METKPQTTAQPGWKKYMNLSGLLTVVCGIFGIVGMYLLIHAWLGFFLEAYSQALNFNGYPTNGAFQLYGPLRRLAAGQVAGVDFQMFHGLGVVLLHYPVFAWLGKDLFASEIARLIISPTLFLLISGTFIYVTTKKWYVTSLVTGLLVLLHYWWFLSLVQPLNSLLGIRSTMPIVFSMVMILLFQSKRAQQIFTAKFPWFELLSGFLLAVTLLMGTEHGFASVLAFGLVYLLFAPYKTFWKRVVGGLEVLGFYLFSVCVIYFAISGVHFLEPLKYAFVEVPADQFWYFGAPPNQYLTSLWDILDDLYIRKNILFGLGFLILTIGLHFTKKIPYTFAIIFLLVYGLLSNISLLGYYEPYYSEPLGRINTLVGVWLGVTALPLIIKTYIPGIKKWTWLPAGVFGQVFFLVACVVVWQTYSGFFKPITPKLDLLTITDQPDKVKREGVYLNDIWTEAENKILEGTGAGTNRISTFPLTDKNWENGINRVLPGFFMGASTSAEESMQVGQALYFAETGKHVIQKIDKSGLWWNVYVSGPQLDPTGDGYPNTIFIGKPKNEQKLPSIWSVYANVLEGDLGIFQPSGYDYIIHAVGPERRQEYVKSFDRTRPDYVITMRNDFFLYEEWLRNEHWDFYHRLLLNYRIKDVTSYHLIWERIPDQKWQTQDNQGWSPVSVETGVQSVNIPIPADRPSPAVVVVNVEYEIKNRMQWLPYLGNLPRYLITPVNAFSHTPISLTPYKTSMSFPIIVYSDQDYPSLTFRTDAVVPGADFTIKKMEFKLLEMDDQTSEWFSK